MRLERETSSAVPSCILKLGVLMSLVCVGCSMEHYRVTSNPPGALIYYHNPGGPDKWTADQRTPLESYKGIGCGFGTNGVSVQWPDGTMSERRAIPGSVHFQHPMQVNIRPPFEAQGLPPLEQPPCDLGQLPRPKEPTSIAVLDFRTDATTGSNDGEVFADFCREAVHKSRAFQLVERNDMRAILSEEDFANTFKCDDTKCLVDFGRKLMAQTIIQGRVAALNGSFILTLKIVDVSAGTIGAIENLDAGTTADRIPSLIRLGTCRLLSEALTKSTQE